MKGVKNMENEVIYESIERYKTRVLEDGRIETSYQMLGETTDLYETRFLDDGRAEITILMPKEFKWLWICKLNDLYATDEEIEYYKNYDDEEDSAPTECSPP
jgi:hypothetical protein